MAKIGGNITGIIQTKTASRNTIGEAVKVWQDSISVTGWLDLQSGENKYSNFSAKLEESTHVFICDYKAEICALSNSDTRMIIKGVVYDVLLIDNPMELNEHIEISLRRVGAWDGKE